MKRILLDMDDVIADTSGGILQLYNEHFQKNYQREDFFNSDLWQKEVAINYLELRSRLHEPGFFRNLDVKKDAVEVVKKLNEHYEIFILSAATEFPNSLKEKIEWLEEHFSFISWHNVTFCGDKRIAKGDIMIDDHDKNLRHFAGDCLLFNAIHNQSYKENYRCFETWKEIGQYLMPV